MLKRNLLLVSLVMIAIGITFLAVRGEGPISWSISGIVFDYINPNQPYQG